MTTAYLSDIITQMRQSNALIGNSNYKIPVVCVMSYSSQDVETLRSSGRISDTFTANDLAEEYFGVVKDEISDEIGPETFGNFNFIVVSTVENRAGDSTIIMYVDTHYASRQKQQGILAKAEDDIRDYTQQKFLEDLINRGAKRYFNR